MPRVIYIHGFRGSADSAKALLLAEHFQVERDTYPTESVELAHAHLDRFLRSHLGRDAGRTVLVGSSLGGFWARWFAHTLQLPCVLVNPATAPWDSLQPHLGPAAAGFKAFDAPTSGPRAIVLVEKGDEVIPYEQTVRALQGTAEIRVFEGGDHSFVHRDELIAAVREQLET